MNFKRQFFTAIRTFIGFTVILGIIYPLFITFIAQIVLKDNANGSLIKKDGEFTGSIFVAQEFYSPKYFKSRPSANNYDGMNSGGSNFAYTNKKFIDEVKKRAEETRAENFLPVDAKIPADMVLASGSGLDPHISLENAYIQAVRIAKKRNIPEEDVKKLIQTTKEKNFLWVFPQNYVNVLRLNLALDEMKGGQ